MTVLTKIANKRNKSMPMNISFKILSNFTQRKNLAIAHRFSTFDLHVSFCYFVTNGCFLPKVPFPFYPHRELNFLRLPLLYQNLLSSIFRYHPFLE